MTANAPQIHVPQNSNVSSDVKVSNEKTGSGMGKPLDLRVENHDNDCQGCLHDCSILDSKYPSIDDPHNTVSQTQDIAHTDEVY